MLWVSNLRLNGKQVTLMLYDVSGLFIFDRTLDSWKLIVQKKVDSNTKLLKIK